MGVGGLSSEKALAGLPAAFPVLSAAPSYSAALVYHCREGSNLTSTV